MLCNSRNENTKELKENAKIKSTVTDMKKIFDRLSIDLTELRKESVNLKTS